MKKVISFVFAAVLLFGVFISCGNAKWINNLEEGKSLAEKGNKSIFLNFTSDSDELSNRLDEIAFKDKKFLNKYSKNFVFVNIDFSDRLKAENLNPNSTAEEKLAAQKIIEETSESMKIAEKYVIKNLPTALILSKEGFVITQLEFFEINPSFDPNSPNASKAPLDDVLIVDNREKIEGKFDETVIVAKEFKNNLKIATSNGKIEDRVMAIDEIFDNTDFNYRYLLRDLNQIAIDIDKENISGSFGKHAVALANAKAVDAGEDYSKAAEIFIEAAENKKLQPEDRQLMYYQAAMSAFRAGPQNNELVKKYVQESIKVAPESEQVELLNSIIKYIDNSKK